MEMKEEAPLHELGLIEACRGMAEGRFTAEAYTRALLARIASLEEEIRAWTWLEPEAALAAARRCDGRIGQGAAPGPLHGVPMGVKDIFATAGIPTQMGSPAYAGHVPGESARVFLRIEEKGGFVMGKTVTTECAFLTPGKTRNPWNLLHTPGGSSSGSAAAVAAGFVPAALGTQTNGSVIRPAAYCGVVGFKPTQGLLPIEGALTFSHTLDQPGLFTRSAADAAYLASALIGDAAHLSSLETIPSDAPPRLAAVRTPVWTQAEEPARQAFEGQIRSLRRAGATVEEVVLPGTFDLAHQAIRVIMAVEAAVNLEPLSLRRDAALSETLGSFMAEGHGTGAVVYLKALKLRLDLKEELERFLAGYDALITPPTTGEAPDTLAQTGNPCFCSIWSLCGVPAVTVPAGLGPRGLPLGLQIAGRRGRDGAVLSVARWCEGVFSFAPWRGGQR